MNKIFAALCLLVSACVSQAIIVNPGTSVLTPSTNPAVTGTLIASRVDNFSGINALGNTLFTGSIASSVYKESTGLLTFYYQITNNATSITSPTKFNVNNFGGLTTDVDTLTGAGNLPIMTDRQNPSILGFTFSTLPILGGAGPLAPGTSSVVLVSRTNATSYAVGSGQVIDGAVASTFTLAPVPEPSTIAAMGLGAVALLRRRKRS